MAVVRFDAQLFRLLRKQSVEKDLQLERESEEREREYNGLR